VGRLVLGACVLHNLCLQNEDTLDEGVCYETVADVPNEEPVEFLEAQCPSPVINKRDTIARRCVFYFLLHIYICVSLLMPLSSLSNRLYERRHKKIRLDQPDLTIQSS